MIRTTATRSHNKRARVSKRFQVLLLSSRITIERFSKYIENMYRCLKKIEEKLKNPEKFKIEKRRASEQPSKGVQGMLAKQREEALIVKSSLFGEMPLKHYRQILHPGSKLILAKSGPVAGFNKETMKCDLNKPQEKITEDYKISTTKNSAIIDNKQYLRAFSCGPLEFSRKSVPTN
jgi:hypothetical protein